MSHPPPDPAEDLRAMFLSAADTAQPTDHVRPEQLWEAASGAGPTQRRRELLDAVRQDPALAAEWRLALAVQDEVGLRQADPELEEDNATVVRPRRWRRVAAAVATGVALAAGALLVFQPPPGDEPGVTSPMRDGADGLAIGSAMGHGQQLDRHDPTLAWTDLGPGVRYSVTVTDGDLQEVASIAELEEPRWTLPDQALQELPPGSRLLWRVDAVLPGGRRLSSPTFAIRVD